MALRLLPLSRFGWLLLALFSVAVWPGSASNAADEGLTEREQLADPEALQQQYEAWAREFNASLNKQHGVVQVPGGVAQLDLGDKYYYLGPTDASRVLTEAWGNPQSGDTLGMIFPAEYSPLDEECWGVTLDYAEDGYVSDDDAGAIDYDQLIADMKESISAENKERQAAGFESIELVGWASPPHYDSANHKLHWAKEIRFGDSDTHTLNYNIRALGRKGVLELNFIADMSQLDEINRRRDEVMAATSFNEGYRYAEFDPSIDKIAAYGIGGLIAGKVLLKGGILLKLALIFKKFWILMLVAGGAAVKRLFGGKAGST